MPHVLGMAAVELGLPTLHSGYWDPFFAACNDTDTLVCMHIGSSSQMPATSSDAPTPAAQTRPGRVVATDGDFALGSRALILARRVSETASAR